MKCGDELNTCLKRVHQIFWPWKKFAKYLYFSNSIFTMMGAPDQKIILRCFFEHTLIYLCVKFQVGLTCPTGFLPTSATFFTNIWREYFSPNLLRVFDQPEVEFLKSGQNWANTRPLLWKTFESSNCVDRHIVHCHSLLSGNKNCHEFRFSIVRIVISVSNVTSLQHHLVPQLWAPIAAHNSQCRGR